MGPGVMPRDNAKTLQLLNILEDPKGRQEVDATDTPDTSRLERAAKAARFPINVSRVRSLASRPLGVHNWASLFQPHHSQT